MSALYPAIDLACDQMSEDVAVLHTRMRMSTSIAKEEKIQLEMTEIVHVLLSECHRIFEGRTAGNLRRKVLKLIADRETEFQDGKIDMSEEDFVREQLDIHKFLTDILQSREPYSTQQYQRWEQIRKLSVAIDGVSHNVKENDEDKDD